MITTAEIVDTGYRKTFLGLLTSKQSNDIQVGPRFCEYEVKELRSLPFCSQRNANCDLVFTQPEAHLLPEPCIPYKWFKQYGIYPRIEQPSPKIQFNQNFRFLEIQQAYEKLSDIKHRRMSRNKRSDKESASEEPISA